MKSANILNMTAALIAASTLSTSCKPEEKPVVESEVALTAHVVSLGNDDLAGKTADIGVFALEPGTSNIYRENANIVYNTVLGAGILSLYPADKGIKIIGTEDIIDVAAYYPHSTELVTEGEYQYVCHMDYTDQVALKPGMLMFAKEKDLNSVKHTATLALKPMFSKIHIHLMIQTTKADEADAEIFLEGLSPTASVDLMTGSYISYGTASSVRLITEAALYSYIGYLPAQNVTDDSLLKVILPGIETPLTVNLKEHIEVLETNRQYNIEVTVAPEGVKATLVEVSDLYISGWKEDIEDLNGNTNN